MPTSSFDALNIQLADYIMDYHIISEKAWETAQYCLADSIGCAIKALAFPACTKLLGPWVPGMTISQGARVLGTHFELDPIKAAFDIGTLIRWLDYNDTWLAQEWGHPSDNLGGILSVMDFVSRRAEYHQQYTVKDILDAMIRAYEIQGILALDNSFNAIGLDHVVLVKVATTGIVTKLLGGDKKAVLNALSHAWIDGQALRTYRHAPNTGSRKSWAAGDATSRGVRLALLTLQGEKGYASALSAPQWGVNDVYLKNKPLQIHRNLSSYVMENILFKIAYPAEFHAQTAVECALKLFPQIKHPLSQITQINLTTQSAAMRIIHKTGPLLNPADRDHCLEYMVAVALIDGKVTAESYEDVHAQNPLIDELRAKMQVTENPQYSADYLDSNKRSIANSVEIIFADGTALKEVVEYPLGHPRRREEGLPLLWEKCEKNLSTLYSATQVKHLITLLQSPEKLWSMPVDKFMEQWFPPTV